MSFLKGKSPITLTDVEKRLKKLKLKISKTKLEIARQKHIKICLEREAKQLCIDWEIPFQTKVQNNLPMDITLLSK